MKTKQVIKKAERLIKRDKQFFNEQYNTENLSRKLAIDKIRILYHNDNMTFAEAKHLLDKLSFDIITNIDYSRKYSYYKYPPLNL